MLSERPWSVEAAARLVMGVIVTFCVGLVLAGVVQEPWMGLSKSQSQFIAEVIMVLFFHVAVLLWITFFLRLEKISWTQAFGLQAFSRNRALALGITAGLVFLPIAWGLQKVSAIVMIFLHLNPEPQAVVEQLQTNLPLAQKVFFGVLAVMLAPTAEELIFRGILYPTIKQIGYPKVALWGTSLLFAISHANAVTFIPLAAFAILLIWLYETTDDLLAPVLAHCVFNMTNFVFLLIGGGGD